MSDQNEQDQDEKSQQPTERRKQQAKEKGQVPRSRELTTMMIVMFGAGLLLFTGTNVMQTLMDVMKQFFSASREVIFDFNEILALLNVAAIQVFYSLVPLFAVLFVIALAAPGLLGGWTFSTKSLAFKGEKISFFKGMKRMFSMRSLTELIKSVLKFILILAVAILMVWHNLDTLMSLDSMPVHKAIFTAMRLVGLTLLVLSSALLVISAIDVPFQLWDHHRKLKMSFKELKDESKETEGSPELKQKLKQAQQTIAQQRMLNDASSADVVITNPTHYAIALKYDDGNMAAPRLVAKGRGLMAARIRQIATENDINMIPAPELARAIYYNTELGAEIPEELYMAVAKVLAYVFQLKQFQSGQGAQPAKFDGVEVPSGLQTESELDRIE